VSSVLVLGDSGPNAADTVRLAASLGHDVHCAVPAPRKPHDSSAVGPARPVVFDFGAPDVERRIADYATAHRVGGVLTTNEFLTPLAARACARLGLPGNSPGLADAPRNKCLMARQFALHRVTAPRTFIVNTLEELVKFARHELGFPLVVKPAANAGSSGVTIVTSPDMLPEAFASARNQGGDTAPLGIRLDPRVVVQEHITGQEFSVESVTQDGISTHLCITRKLLTTGPYPIEIGHSLPARLEAAVEQRIFAEATRALLALGIVNSTSHLELLLTDAGSCYVIEVAARTGAGQISRLLELARGISLHRASIDVALGMPALIEPRCAGYAASRLFVAPMAGRLVAVRNLPAEGDGVCLVQLTRALDTLVSGPMSNKARVGHFVVHGSGEAEVNDYADKLLAQVEVAVDPSGVAEAGHGRS
jgi:hypothetical protein